MPHSKHKKTAADEIYEQLRSSIIDLHIRPGTMISIKELAEQMNKSRSPVRDALIRLEKEGLITTMPQYGTMVSKIDMERVFSEQFLRLSLEEKNIILFAECHTSQDLQKLHAVLLQSRSKADTSDYRSFLEYDDHFHGLFFEATGKKFCWETVQSVSGHYRRFRLLSFSDNAILQNILAQHEEILRLAGNRDRQGLVAAIQQHLSKIDQESVEFARRFPDIFTNLKLPVHPPASLLNADFLHSLNQ